LEVQQRLALHLGYADDTAILMNGKFPQRLYILKEPTIFNKMIHLTGEVKYFGLTSDKGLTWN
jgi:hypothetical protein